MEQIVFSNGHVPTCPKIMLRSELDAVFINVRAEFSNLISTDKEWKRIQNKLVRKYVASGKLIVI